MSTTTYRAARVQVHTPVEGQSYKSVSWHWRVETAPGAFLAGEDGKPLEFDTKAAAEVAAFDADPHAWTDENGMRYRCKRCHEPMLSILPAELTSGVCRCGGLIEADPRNFAEIDPALYGLPQDSEIGAEVYPEPTEELRCLFCGDNLPLTPFRPGLFCSDYCRRAYTNAYEREARP